MEKIRPKSMNAQFSGKICSIECPVMINCGWESSQVITPQLSVYVNFRVGAGHCYPVAGYPYSVVPRIHGHRRLFNAATSFYRRAGDVQGRLPQIPGNRDCSTDGD